MATAAAIIAAPYVLPSIHLGSVPIADAAISLCSNTTGGLTQALEGALISVPGIGQYLGTTGWTSSITSGAIGIAGVLLGDYIHKHYDRKGHIQWGTIIKYAALTTSILVALPSILSGISMGATFLAGLFSNDAMLAARNVLAPTLGFSGTEMIAPAGLAGLAPHLLTCGRALLPLAATFWGHQKTVNAELRDAYSIQMMSPPLTTKGKPTTLAFQLIDNKTGRALTEAELATTHTKKLHTMIIDSSLTDYHHVHPEYDPERKLFTCQFTPNLQAPYRMWSDFTVLGEKRPTQLKNDISNIRSYNLPPRIAHTSHVEGAGFSVDISSTKPLRAGEEAILQVDIRDASGQPVTDLEPIMGAFGHLAGFSRDGNFFTHSHPMSHEPQSADERGFGQLRFHLTPPTDEPTKFFLQVQRHGQIITIPFGQMVARAQTQGAGTFQAAIMPQIAGMGKNR